MAEEKKNLFGTLLQKEGFYKASTIVEELASKVPNRQYAYSTSPCLSWMTACGFVPGTMSLWYGPKSSGKTMLVLDVLKNFQRQEPDAIVVFVDAEMSFEYKETLVWMQANGIDLDRVLVIRDVCIIEIFETHILKTLNLAIKNEGVKICAMALDSIQAMSVLKVPDTEATINKAAKDNALSKQDFGKRANYLAKIFPFFRMFCRDNRIHTCLIGQARSGGKDSYGNPIWETNGGEALFHEVQYRFLVQQAGEPIFHPTKKDINGKEVKIGHNVKVVCEKNKLSDGLGRIGIIAIEYMKGVVNKEEELAELVCKLGIAEQTGAWCNYNGQKYNGAKKFAEAIKADDFLYKELFDKVMFRAN